MLIEIARSLAIADYQQHLAVCRHYTTRADWTVNWRFTDKMRNGQI